MKFIIPFLFSSAFIFSQNNFLLTNINSRDITSLDGEWQIIIDPFENGYYNYRYEPSGNGFFINQKPESKSDLIEYDFDKSETLTVPGDWNNQKEKLFLYEGTIWYKKDFDYNLKSGDRLFVYFGAVNYKAIVYLNGKMIGEHEGGFTPFNFEITAHIKKEDNFLIVKVDNKRSREFIPTVNTDWWNYGGITRSVSLVEESSTFIQDYFIQLEKESINYISGWIKLNGKSLSQKISVKIPELNIAAVCETNINGECYFRINTEPDLWSPENPKLYDVIISADTDSISERIGFRTIAVKGDEILLNGTPVFLKGISVHEEAPIRSGRANSIEDAETILNWVKELSGNFVRLAHYPHNENIVRLADEMGILIWSEIPVYWTILWDNEKTYQNAETQLAEMISRDKNRASIILWSVANETPLSEARLNFLKRLTEKARSLDNTRLITAALEHHYINDSTIAVDDPFGEYLDVIGQNEYLGWYDGLPDKIKKINWQTNYDKPIIISEFGAGARQGLHGDKFERWTEEYQSYVYEEQLKLISRIKNIKGMSPWILTDFRSPRRNLPGIQDFWNRKGIISDKGIKKGAFFILQKFYEAHE